MVSAQTYSLIDPSVIQSTVYPANPNLCFGPLQHGFVVIVVAYNFKRDWFDKCHVKGRESILVENKGYSLGLS